MAFYKLSKSEREVYNYLLQGLSNKDISSKLYVTEKTIKFHLTNIYKKFNVSGGLDMRQGQNNLATKADVTSEALNKIDQKFKVGEVMNHLHSMMKGVTENDMTPETVMAACQCVSKMNEVMNTSIDAARFLRDNG